MKTITKEPLKFLSEKFQSLFSSRFHTDFQTSLVGWNKETCFNELDSTCV